jgi:hypothetical protein
MNDTLHAEKINCPCFTKKYNQITDNKQKVKRSVRGIEKAIYAEDCEQGIDELLDCSNYDALNIDCVNCRIVANLEKNSTEIRMQMKATA